MNTRIYELKMDHGGFTLLELLIAMSIFSIVAAIAFAGLHTVLSAQEGIKNESERLAELQKAFIIIQRDVGQAVDRSIRDGFGDHQAAMAGGDSRSFPLEFTRTGHANPRNEPRSNLLRVGYRTEDGSLIRTVWHSLDQAAEEQPSEVVLLSGLSSIVFRFIDEEGKPQRQWPKSSLPDQPPPSALPVALELVLELEDWGEIVRLFAINDT
ncbi:MAG TPA: type II secretion system protein GspJ [Chromatiales bacterium]|nr:type II secretion system protein GspJ [Chromatiales bacterium]